MSDVQPKKGNGAGVAGLILGILAVILAIIGAIIPVFNWIAYLFWIPGLICAIVAMVKKQKHRVGGLVLNISAIVLPWILRIAIVGGLAAMI